MSVIEESKEQAEISLLEFLLVIAENIKLLVLGPVVAGLLALAIALALPQKFVSQAILAFPSSANTNAAQAAVMMVSPLVLDPVLVAHDLTKGRSIQVARTELADQVKAAVGKDGLLRLDVTANSAQEAHALANDIIDSWLKSTALSEQERKGLEKRLSVAQIGLKAVTALLDRLALDGGASLAKQLARGEAGTGLVAVGALLSQYLTDVLTIPNALQGLSRDVVKQPPTLPTGAVSPKQGIIFAIVTFGAGFLLLPLVFVRQAWRRWAMDPSAAQMQMRVLHAFGLSGRANKLL